MKNYKKNFKKGNYAETILESYLNGKLQLKPGTVSVIDVEHDAWCEIYKGGSCNCNPNIIQHPPLPK